MNQLDVVQSLGGDVVLLTRPDRWLKQRTATVSQQLSILVEEVKVLQTASDIKRKMQDKNLVAVRHTAETDGLPDEVIEIMGLQEAIALLEQDDHSYDQRSQMNVWRADGYDVETTSQLRYQ